MMNNMRLRGPAFVCATASVSLSSVRSSWVCSHPAIAANAARTTRTQFTVGKPQSASTTPRASLQTEVVGEENTMSFRLLFKNAAGEPVSPWHDLPLHPTDDRQIINFVNEIPLGNQAKMEISTDEERNPIKQDIKKGALRFYKYGPSLVNYGAVPQTWEDPGSIHPELNVKGDGDPLDVTEISSKVMPFGSVYPVKVLGALALLDEGEIDWKIIAINVDDPLAPQMNDIADVEKLMPGRVAEVREWFRMYKTAEGKGQNEYAYGGETKGRDETMTIIEETHQSWVNLLNGTIPNDDELALK